MSSSILIFYYSNRLTCITIVFPSIYRIADIYVLGTAITGICGSMAFSDIGISITVGSIEFGSSSTTKPPFDGTMKFKPTNDENLTNITNLESENNTTSNATETDLLHLVAQRMTGISILYELMVAYLIMFTIIMVIICCVGIGFLSEKFKIDLSKYTVACCVALLRLIRPFMFIDSVAIIILAPFGNVYFFVLGCPLAYVTIGLRVGLYLSTISFIAVDSYIREHEEPRTKELRSFLSILFKFTLKLLTCSSCLATFINIAYPEPLGFRYTYLIFTVLIGLTALVTYYDNLMKIVEVVRGCFGKFTTFHNWVNHFTFWPSFVSNLCLFGMNAFILHKYLETDGFNSSGVSLVLNFLSLITAVPLYVLTGSFCGHGPLSDVCQKKQS